MSKFKTLILLILLITTPTMFVYPYDIKPNIQPQRVHQEIQTTEEGYTLSYDDILKLFREIESGELEERCNPVELEKVKHFLAFLAQQGVLPDNSEESLSLDRDIDDLLHGEDNVYESVISFAAGEYQYGIPTFLNGQGQTTLCKSWVKKQCKQVKKFTKKHKKALIIGGSIVAGAGLVVVIIVSFPVAGAAAVGAVAAAGASSTSTSSDRVGFSPNILTSRVTEEAPLLKSTLDQQISSYKENIVQNQFFQPFSPSGQSLSWEEDGRALGSIFAHHTYHSIQNQLPNHPRLAREIEEINLKYSLPQGKEERFIAHPEIDRKFATDYSHLYTNPVQEVEFNTLSFQVRGESALAHGYYKQAVQDLGRAIEANPTNPLPYLERGMAHFNLGQYDRSLADYNQFISQIPPQNPFVISEFSIGFAKGLPRGVYESGEGLFLFMADFVTHPIQTSGQMVDSVSTLVELVRKDEWGIIAESLSPEVYQLVTQWDTLPSEKRGELTGYALGKHGADILAPGALAKVAAKSVRSAQELVSVCKKIQIAQETLVLETAAGVGSAKIAEVVEAGRKTAFLAEELGFSAQEIGQLKKVGKLETAIDNSLEKLVSQSESEVFKTAISQEKHVRMVRDYLDKPVKEIRKGIKSYEKLIAEHKDKIENPTKHCAKWDKLDPRERQALINKRWPMEINLYEKQKEVLQSILNERLSHGQ